MTIKTRLYGCGGCGVNLGQAVASDHLTACYIDTSESNRTETLDPEVCHYLENLDGSGKNRRENYEPIIREVGVILDRFEPADFNIVLFSAAGGSGSVLGPLIMKNLLEREYPVVAVVVGADDSAIAVTNTINTLKSLESISAVAGQPVVMAYHENTAGVTRQMIDDEVLFVLEALGELTSQENRELDTKDLTNWVQYQKVAPSVPPQLSALSIFDSRQEASGQVEPIAIASLYNDPGKDNAFGTPFYATVGYPRNEMMLAEQLHFVVNTADVEDVFTHLTERQSELNKAYNQYRQRRTRVDIDDNLTGDGMIL